MIELEFMIKEYEFLCKYVEEIKRYEIDVIKINDKIKLKMTWENFEMFQGDFDSSIVYFGMDNQDTVNEIGIELYRIYDERIM